MAPPGPLVTLLRHGETEWSRSGQHTGVTDIPLTGRGEAQAAAAARLLDPGGYEKVLVSPRIRARRTAQLAGLGDGVVDHDLQEWDYGDFEGMTSAEIRERVPSWSIWEGPWRGGETAEEVTARVDRVLARVLAEPPGAKVALVAHGHVLRVVGARWVGQPASSGRWLGLDTAAVCELGWEHDTRILKRWNLTTTTE